ncbi:UDP-N-acetylglucosamine transferase subunit ALG14 [Plasmodium brasilianum]|uniref:UDP-N-acetylglucosamine transferase subunit ALG14 n=2 Tax=Plasmodium (Plasmodium) TaxID=418103 RepID=A0A1C3KAK6_PLAMA|nr:dolichol-linked oligosaccharide biosynthesis enzyme, putative [Plasmodium malariae]KAI4840421.1 UDP-N-acetylglucosamine transferase subunit ALG14 [Plasmodium brasilianum]SBT70583.1 dolichol-linked oligosaccharide biosynthesis enzyme, putative [Plasmodium malariae]SBT86512.1 dolichol-linked oligosaccharide biosynthesis enzyme, putative [Plasmodium malariae]
MSIIFLYVNVFFFLWFILIYLKSKFWYIQNKVQNHDVEIGVVLGSGGHTFEILEILKIIKNSNINFHLFYASNDNFSKIKAENTLKNYKKNFLPIPRCRNVGESYLLSFVKFFITFIYCIFITYKMNNMNLIIVNGPGTCVPVVFSLLFRKYIFLKQIKIVYLESVCRIYSLSLSAKLLYYFSDLFVVFSEHLQKKYKKAKFYGYLF